MKVRAGEGFSSSNIRHQGNFKKEIYAYIKDKPAQYFAFKIASLSEIAPPQFMPYHLRMIFFVRCPILLFFINHHPYATHK